MLTPEHLLGQWQLESSNITIGSETHSHFDASKKRIKLFTLTHFALFSRSHDRTPFSRGVPDAERLAAAKTFDAACGRYSINAGIYTEHVDYASFPNYEGQELQFKLSFDGNTLVQEGIYPLKRLGFSDQDGFLSETYSRLID